MLRLVALPSDRSSGSSSSDTEPHRGFDQRRFARRCGHRCTTQVSPPVPHLAATILTLASDRPAGWADADQPAMAAAGGWRLTTAAAAVCRGCSISGWRRVSNAKLPHRLDASTRSEQPGSPAISAQCITCVVRQGRVVSVLWWTEANEEHIARHGVDPGEVTDVVIDPRSRWFRATNQPLFHVFGRSDAGRYLFRGVGAIHGRD